MADKGFDALETVLKWAETEDEMDCTQIMKLKRLQTLAARKRGIGLKQTVIDNSSKKCKSTVLYILFCFLITFIAVSYTHLDVYKRQAQA